MQWLTGGIDIELRRISRGDGEMRVWGDMRRNRGDNQIRRSVRGPKRLVVDR